LTQVWMSEGLSYIDPHDVYFTIGETVGLPDARFPDGGLRWEYTPPCVSLESWPVWKAPPDAPFTTLSNWGTSKEWFAYGEVSFANDKRSGFLPFLDLPRRTDAPIELALCLAADEQLRLQ